jgi:hypothetical protein
MSVKRLIEFLPKNQTSVTPYILSLASIRAQPVTGNEASAPMPNCNSGSGSCGKKRTVA